MKELTVLSAIRDPYRLDTPARHRDGLWFAQQVTRTACHELVNFPETVHYDGGPLYTLFCELDALRETVGLPRRAVEAEALFGSLG
jgi:hypothetical protein